MEFQTYVSWISSPVQIAFLDLVLGADNAVIIALVCRSLPRSQRMNVMIVGTGAALLLRIILTMLTGALMFTPLLRIAGGCVLILIAVTLTEDLDVGRIADASDADGGAPQDANAASEAFWDAILLVVVADGIMSLDNTVALAAVANGNVVYLILGLALSVPTIVFGSWILSELLGQSPFVARIAMAVLAWIAGDMAVSDPLVADWITTTAPALALGIPIAAVVFVLAKAAFKPVTVPLPLAVTVDRSHLDAEAPEMIVSKTPPESSVQPLPQPEIR
jgi:YjbE family integral membrane protein